MILGHIAGIPVEEMLPALVPWGGLTAGLAAVWFQKARRHRPRGAGKRESAEG
jgi:hypothetical protein